MLWRFCAGLFLLLASILCWADTFQQAQQAGSSAGQQFQSKYGSKEGISKYFSAPVTSSSAKMEPLLGEYWYCPNLGRSYMSQGECQAQCPGGCEKGFSAQLTAPSSSAFLEVFISPSGTGDIQYLAVRQDTNFDGSFDYAWTASVPISGICANGFISCQPGTWKNCRYFLWAVSDRLRITTKEITAVSAGLSACYCINTSCGGGSYLFWNNAAVILEHLGGGIVSALQGADPHLAVTAVKTDPMQLTISYFGQKTQGVASQGSSGVPFSGTPRPEVYYQDPVLLQGAAETELWSQGRDPSSMWNLVVSSPASRTRPYETRTCTVRRDVSLQQQTRVIGLDAYFYVGAYHKGDPEYCFTASRGGQCLYCVPMGDEVEYWECENIARSRVRDVVMLLYYGSGCVPYTDPFTGKSGCWTPSAQPAVFGPVEIVEPAVHAPPICCHCCDAEVKYNLRALWHVDAYFEPVSNCVGVAKRDGLILCADEKPKLQKTDTCTTLNTAGCRLKDEQVCDRNGKCIYTVKDFSRTGLTLLPQCANFPSDLSGGVWTVCTDGRSMTYGSTMGLGGVLESGTDVWWEMRRTYYCELGQVYDLSQASQRLSSIQETASLSGSQLVYRDYLPASGRYEWGQATVPDFGSLPECEMVCRVQVPKPETDVGASGHSGEYLVSTTSYRFEFRVCSLQGSNYVCPFDPQKGEKVDAPCGCLNSFNEAASLMTVLSQAAKDIICSTKAP